MNQTNRKVERESVSPCIRLPVEAPATMVQSGATVTCTLVSGVTAEIPVSVAISATRSPAHSRTPTAHASAIDPTPDVPRRLGPLDRTACPLCPVSARSASPAPRRRRPVGWATPPATPTALCVQGQLSTGKLLWKTLCGSRRRLISRNLPSASGVTALAAVCDADRKVKGVRAARYGPSVERNS